MNGGDFFIFTFHFYKMNYSKPLAALNDFRLFLLTALLNLALIPGGQAQDSSEREYYNWFDSQVGVENTGLFNGTRYRELYRIRDGKHKFFQSPEFLTGNLLYDGQPYYDIPMKYDLFEDELIIELQAASGKSILKLLKDEVEGFEIDGHKFRHLRDTKVYRSADDIDGFYEVLSETSSILLLKKHLKLRKKVLEDKMVLNEFREDDSYYIHYEGLYHPVRNKNDLIKAFPESKKEINDFYSGSKFLLKTDPDLFMKRILERIDSSLTPNSTSSL